MGEREADLLPKVPATVTVDRRAVLRAALFNLDQHLCDEQIDSVDSDLYVCTLTVGLLPHRLCFNPSKRTFYGVSDSGSVVAAREAYENAFGYLEENELVSIDDIGSKKTKKLAQAASWTNLFQQKLSILQPTMLAAEIMHQNILTNIHAVCEKCSGELQVEFIPAYGEQAKKNMPPMLYNGPIPAEARQDG